eukprot:GGOE01063463.1.p1 GENE.GGOE01063463.1~~GGOE01063463.1.p1  ORF type:complete len:1261 (+),score=405.71 GGOE01063463.1:492-3785(+)
MDEVVVHAMLMVQQLWVHRIACFYQNDTFGFAGLNALVAALSHVGLNLVASGSYPPGSTAVEAAVEAIASAPEKAQAVVMVTLEPQTVKFLSLFKQDNRTDPSCVFVITATSATSTFPTKVPRQYWSSLYFTQVVPPLDTPGLSIVPQFLRAAALYLPANLTPDPFSFQAYLAGSLIIQVLRGIPGEITRMSFLDQLYNTRLYVFGGLVAGLYSRNTSGCERMVCSSNIGLRTIFLATMDPQTGAMHYNSSLGYYSFAITELSFPYTSVVRPLLFGQLLPLDDAVWQLVAETIGHALQSAFAKVNAAGGVDGRPVELVQRRYSGDPAPHAAALAERYDVLALVGSVVNYSESLRSAPAQLGTYQTSPYAVYPSYDATEVSVQASLPLEIMALVAYAFQLGLPVHIRAPATTEGQTALEVMVKSLNTLQQQPASSRTFHSAVEALQGISTGAVLAVGSDEDLQAMFFALADAPQVRLLTSSPRAVHLLASLNVADYSQATRFHYPYMFNTSSLQVTTGPEVLDAKAYGSLLGGVMEVVLASADNSSLAYTTTSQVLDAWYGKQFKVNGVTLGPYFSSACYEDVTDCECNEGVRQVTVLTARRQEEPLAFHYALTSCRVAYTELVVTTEGMWYVGVIVGVVVGTVVLVLLGGWLARRGQRDNAAAPKDASQPFCILFTDIQASTHLWATIPDVMATALHAHHTLIRKLLAKFVVYEVKTIGDSFMCATRSPSKAVEFSLALQWELFEYDWDTHRIDTVYFEQLEDRDKWPACHTGWNGLRVRVGIHYGTGDIYLDPVSKGFDYYGTVVNTAARVEAVCHGGQIGITQAVFDALDGKFPGVVLADLGKQILRGLGEPVHLYQLLPSELGGRKFPPLRLEYAATVEVKGCPQSDFSTKPSRSRGAVVPVGEGSSSPGSPTSDSPTSPKSSAGTSPTNRGARSSMVTATPNWVETHPMVRSGQMTAEELLARFLTVQKALFTLLEVQTHRVRESALTSFCDRLHVRYVGCEGNSLEDTLSGIVQRVLPAALAAVRIQPPSRHGSSFQRRASIEASTPISHSGVISELLPITDQQPSPHPHADSVVPTNPPGTSKLFGVLAEV